MPELAQTFTVTLSGPTGATLGTPATITVSITDNDGGAGFGSGVVNRPDERRRTGAAPTSDCTLDDALAIAAADTRPTATPSASPRASSSRGAPT